jgi:periplasmic divalent cation tolerance protein
MGALLVMTNAPDRATAERIAHHLVEARLAACVNILAECRSVYRWQGAVETATEVPLLVKTGDDQYAAVERAIRALHPHEVPEVVAIAIDRGAAPYLEWLAAQVGPAA